MCKGPTQQNERGDYSIPKCGETKASPQMTTLSKNKNIIQLYFKILPRIRERVEQNYSAILKLFQETLLEGKQVQLESGLLMWKLQYE